MVKYIGSFTYIFKSKPTAPAPFYVFIILPSHSALKQIHK